MVADYNILYAEDSRLFEGFGEKEQFQFQREALEYPLKSHYTLNINVFNEINTVYI